MMLKIQLWHQMNKLHFKIYSNGKWLFEFNIFSLNKCSLGQHETSFENKITHWLTPNIDVSVQILFGTTICGLRWVCGDGFKQTQVPFAMDSCLPAVGHTNRCWDTSLCLFSAGGLVWSLVWMHSDQPSWKQTGPLVSFITAHRSWTWPAYCAQDLTEITSFNLIGQCYAMPCSQMKMSFINCLDHWISSTGQWDQMENIQKCLRCLE